MNTTIQNLLSQILTIVQILDSNRYDDEIETVYRQIKSDLEIALCREYEQLKANM